MFFVERPGLCRFVIRQVNMVPGRSLSTAPLTVRQVGEGKSMAIPAPGDTPTEVVYNAESRGFYRIILPEWGTRLRVDRTSVPIAIDATEDLSTIAPLLQKSFALTFGFSGEPFAFLAYGSDYYRFKIAMFDVDGSLCEGNDMVDGVFVAYDKKGDTVGFRKAVFGLAEKPNYDHISFRLYGGQGFFFLSDKKRWRCKQLLE